MKRYGNLFKKIYEMSNLQNAYLHAKSGKGRYEEVRMIEKRPGYYLAALQWMLKTGNYHTSEYDMFRKTEGKKEREIYKLPFFPDRIAQWAILQIMEKSLLRYFTNDTYSAIKEKGIHAALKNLRAAVNNYPFEMVYCLKIDCKKYYPSISHEILKKQFRHKYKDPELLNVLDEIIDSISTCPATDENIAFYKSLGHPIKIIQFNNEQFIDGVGIPIGNYLSQYNANFYLTGFDHWMKEVMHVKHYYRYMDDVCVFSDNKKELWDILKEINHYFRDKLNIRVKKNYQVFPTFVRGVDFVGYRTFKDYTLLRKSTCKDMKRKLTTLRVKVESGKEMNYSEWCSIASYRGWLKHCNSRRLSEKYITPLQPYADKYYLDHIKKKKKGGNADESIPKDKKQGAA